MTVAPDCGWPCAAVGAVGTALRVSYLVAGIGEGVVVVRAGAAVGRGGAWLGRGGADAAGSRPDCTWSRTVSLIDSACAADTASMGTTRAQVDRKNFAGTVGDYSDSLARE